MTLTWNKQDKRIRDFNGIRRTARIGGREYGVFRERPAIAGRPWSVRTRPLDSQGQPLYGWGMPVSVAATLREAVGWVEELAGAQKP